VDNGLTSRLRPQRANVYSYPPFATLTSPRASRGLLKSPANAGQSLIGGDLIADPHTPARVLTAQ